ncbi:MAG: 16S rRNA (cytosine(1402)-N(4))-methyltransferase RsmH [Oscillospiraceae bacterium]|nr:16S rRNA (cytosine(1402)-N(4))-methyltransferase RsmH [Oscillospiraceae bacterium]
MEFKHIPVLLNESIEALNIKSNGIYVDGTLGGAGHSLEILKMLSSAGVLVGIDRDENAIKFAKEKLKEFQNVKYIHDNYCNIQSILNELAIEKVDGILLDLGVSSHQIDEDSRGFSYIKDSLLDMRMDKTQEFSAYNVINEYEEKKLSDIIYKYGEEKFSRRIAQKICEYRNEKPIRTTLELAEIIKSVVPNFKGGHPAKRTFQAIRIEVNNELEPLYKVVMDCIDLLNKNGRLCIITFHSLEDRIVKNAFVDATGRCTCPKGIPYCVCGAVCSGKVITKKPIIPTEDELKNNPRSTSAKLRVFEKN